MKSKVLITGGLSFIMSHVTEWFVMRGYEVIVIDNCSVGSHPEIVDGSFKFYQCDLTTDESWKIIVEEMPEYIIHAAAQSDVDFSLKNPRQTIVNNVLSMVNVFKGARNVARMSENFKRLLYVNTDEVYGECEHPKNEEELMFPRNPYSASKAMCAYIRTSYDCSFPELKEKTAEIRMCNIFGPRQDTRKIMPLLVRAVKNGDTVPLQNEGEGYREYLYVKNIPLVIEAVLLRGHRVYNVTNNDGFTVVELIKKFEEITGKKIKTKPANRPSHDRWYRMDNSRLKELGWHPLYSFEDGLREYLKIENIL